MGKWDIGDDEEWVYDAVPDRDGVRLLWKKVPKTGNEEWVPDRDGMLWRKSDLAGRLQKIREKYKVNVDTEPKIGKIGKLGNRKIIV